ncbi:DUF305 domain-containing protein [Nesterenkonia aurantiaca]|uniref:Uncharacterized protein (DUF305 family) n=1 Tax=Nesterenkonia aurantiaca TaxID=1436010 RepID=A0A4R7G5Z2_9MICC|nr:DUF305 domain-containing protein [Nesterenkonia aurantiaca]TDS86903.1 uncharacterized protein (DUF305 family) [Nesterenkonia aurantiaca]
MKTRTSAAFIGAFALTAVLAGCGASEDQPGETPSDQEQATEETSAEYNDADVDYLSGMIPHHQQAVHMSEMLLEKDDVEPEVANLAEDIRDAQGPEIEQMESWLDAWGENDAGNGMGGMGDMEDMDHGDMGENRMGHQGMMSEEDLDELDASTGSTASTMYLEHMIVHHEGAVSSAEQHLQEGENPEALELSETIIESQQAEIEQMEELLTNL